MTNVRFYSSAGALFMECRGHAGYNPGNDVVCAGISALVCALAGYAADTPKGDAVIENGCTLIRCKATMRAKTAFELVWRGLKQIELAYPGHIKINRCSTVGPDALIGPEPNLKMP